MGNMVVNFPYEDVNYMEVTGINNIFDIKIFDKNYLNIVDNKINSSGLFLLIDNSLYGKKKIYICQSNNIKKCVENYNQKIKEKRIDWNYDLVIAFLNTTFNKEIRIILGKLLGEFYLSQKKYFIEMENAIKNKNAYEEDGHIDKQSINIALKEIDLFFKTFSFFNLDLCLYTNSGLQIKEKNMVDVNSKEIYNEKNKIIKKEIEKNNIYEKIPNDYLLIRLDDIREEKIIGWVYKDIININSKNLKEVVFSLFTYLYKNNKEQIDIYLKENQYNCKYPILISKKQYEEMDSQKAYSYEKLQDYDNYVFSRMSSKFFIRHINFLFNYLKLPKQDFYFLSKE